MSPKPSTKPAPATGWRHHISVEELAAELHNPLVAVLDGSWYLPGRGRNPKQEYLAMRLPGAQHVDIDSLADGSSGLPHMLPAPEAFAEAMSGLGITPEHHVVVYDTDGMFSAARLWWMLVAYRHPKVSVLHGGLPAWKAAGLPVEHGAISPRAKTAYPVPLQAGYLAEAKDLLPAVLEGTQLVDARSPARFEGREAEPREAMRQGHIPGSLNLYYQKLIDPTTHGLKPPALLEKVFATAGVELSKPIITTCGSGVTAAILCLALAELGQDGWKLYDGSWAEWGKLDNPQPVTHDVGKLTGLYVPPLVTQQAVHTIMDMRIPPDRGTPQAPTGDMLLVHADRIPLSYYRYLYFRIGHPWHWTSRLRMNDEELTAYLHHPMHEVHILYHKGVPAGYFEIDARKADEVRIPYVGLLPEHMGKGLGNYLIHTAIALAWRRAPERVTVNVTSLDHSRALMQLQKAGFSVSRQDHVLAVVYGG